MSTLLLGGTVVEGSRREHVGRRSVPPSLRSAHAGAHSAQVLGGIHDVLRPGGTFLCVDIQASSRVDDNVDQPLGTFLYAVSCRHCMTVSLALDGDGLGTAWGEQLALAMLEDAGLSDVGVRRVDGDILNNDDIARRR